jgi:hypothetical protein
MVSLRYLLSFGSLALASPTPGFPEVALRLPVPFALMLRLRPRSS